VKLIAPICTEAYLNTHDDNNGIAEYKKQMGPSSTRRRHSACYSEEPCKDASIQGFTAATEASTTEELSKPNSSQAVTIDFVPSWETQDVVILDGSFCQSDCSKLTSDHGSSRYNDHDSPQCIESDRSKHNSDLAYYPDNTNSRYDDSFCHTFENDVWWADGLSESGHENLKTNDGDCFIPISRRGRSKSIDITPKRGRSLDVSYQRTSQRIDGRIKPSCRSSANDVTKINDPNSDERREGNNSVASSNGTSSRPKSFSSRNDANTIRRESNRSRKSASSRSKLHKEVIKSGQCIESQRHSTIARIEPNPIDVSVKQGRRQRSIERKAPSSKILESIDDRKEVGRRSRRLSSIERNGRNTSSESCGHVGSHPNRQGSLTQKSIHPLTARLLAEKAITRQNSGPNGKSSQTLEDRRRHHETDTLNQDSSPRGSKNKLRSTHPLTGHLADGRNARQLNLREGHRCLEKQHSFPESPTRKASSFQKLSCDAVKENLFPEHQNDCRRLGLEKQNSCPESPSRRAKTYQQLHPQRTGISEELRGSVRLDARRRRLEKQNSCPESPSRQIKNSHLLTAQSRKTRLINEQGMLEHKPREHKQPGNALKGASRGPPRFKNDERYGPASNYFTPRDSTPVREFSDRLMIEEIPDDSAFWNIEPDAFVATEDPPPSLKEIQKIRFI
jgi:hypothetical protein